MDVPFNDLRAQVDEVREAFLREVGAILDDARFVKGPRVAAFEAAWAAACGARHAVGTSSGTTALELALRVAGVGPCDEVICPAMTFGATVGCVIAVGARPVLADVDPETLLIAPKAVAAAVSPRTRAVVPVHLHGRVARVAKLRTIVGDRVQLIEDAAQAQLAPATEPALAGRRAGALGDAAAFSFYPAKNLGACGDAGAMLTDDDAWAARARRLRDHGREEQTTHLEPGTNYRMSELIAAWLALQLPLLEGRNAARVRLAARYDAALAGLDWLRRPPLDPPSCWHLYVVRCERRDALRAHLAERGVGSGVHYPRAIHQHPAFAPYFAGERYPVAEAAAAESLSLPLFPTMTDAQQDAVVSALASFVA